MDVFTIMALVIAVSGGTFTALAGLRNYYRQEYHTLRSNCETYLEKVSEWKSASARQNAERKTKYFKACQWWWHAVYATPVLLFCVASYSQACFVLWDVAWGPRNAASVQYESNSQDPSQNQDQTENDETGEQENPNPAISYAEQVDRIYIRVSWWGLLVLVVVDTLCIITMWTIWRKFKSLGADIEGAYETEMEYIRAGFPEESNNNNATP